MKGLTFTDDKQSFWVNLDSKEKAGTVTNGRVRVQLDIYPKEDALNNAVGNAREEPNVNPYLPLPVGRLSFSLNPLKMLNQLVGPALRRKLYCACCYILCIAFMVAFGPVINVFTSLFL